jgi:hypothetical protein
LTLSISTLNFSMFSFEFGFSKIDNIAFTTS